MELDVTKVNMVKYPSCESGYADVGYAVNNSRF
jgi:hypothetical protein